MARTASNMLPLGTKAPDFSHEDAVTGQKFSLEDISGGKGTLIMFLSNHCPFVKHISSELASLGKDYKDKPIGIAGIMSNDVDKYPEDHPVRMKDYALDYGYVFPYLYDESQKTAMDYKAACTPDFFLFDGHLKLAYRGQLDDSRPGNDKPLTGKDLRQAMDALLNGQAVPEDQKPSIGCSIKWK